MALLVTILIILRDSGHGFVDSSGDFDFVINSDQNYFVLNDDDVNGNGAFLNDDDDDDDGNVSDTCDKSFVDGHGVGGFSGNR